MPPKKKEDWTKHAITLLNGLKKVSQYLKPADRRCLEEAILIREEKEDYDKFKYWLELLFKKDPDAERELETLEVKFDLLFEEGNALESVRALAFSLRNKRYDEHPLSEEEWTALLKMTVYRKPPTKRSVPVERAESDTSSTTAPGESNVVLGSENDGNAGRDNFKVVDNSQRIIGNLHIYKGDDQSSSGSQKNWEVSCLADILANMEIRCHVTSDPDVFNKLRELAGTLLKNRKIMDLTTHDQYKAVVGLATHSRNTSTGDEKIKNILVDSQQTTNKDNSNITTTTYYLNDEAKFLTDRSIDRGTKVGTAHGDIHQQ